MVGLRSGKARSDRSRVVRVHTRGRFALGAIRCELLYARRVSHCDRVRAWTAPIGSTA